MIRTDFVKANGLTFEVDMCGSGDKFAICLHGFPELAYSWRYQLPFLACLGYTVWAPNLRGYGLSSRPTQVGDYALESLIADVVELIAAAGASSTLLIGHDWGGFIAWMLALQKHCEIDQLIVMNIPHPAIFAERMWQWPQILKSWYIFFFQIPKLPEILLGANQAGAIAKAFHNMAIDKSRFPEEVLSIYQEHAQQPGVLTAMINYYRANFFLRSQPNTAMRALCPTQLETPTLMIWGEEDSALGKELTFGTENLVTNFRVHYLPSVSHWVLPNVSHWVQQEQPDLVNACIEEWLTEVNKPVLPSDSSPI